MYRSALVALKPGESNKELLAYAVELAQRHSLLLSGIAILDRDLVSPPEAVSIGGTAFKAELDEARIARAKEQMASVTTVFSEHCSAAGVPFNAFCSTDELSPELAREVQRHDVLLLGHGEGVSPDRPKHDHSVLHMVLRRCPSPAIVVPRRPAAGAESVVVAYDGSTQATRALRSFIASGFETQSPIHVVSFDDDPAAAQSAASLARDLLLGHGYRAHSDPEVIPTGRTEAELIHASCRMHGARLLVMGAYGRPALREYLFGSATKSLLDTEQLPIFLDH